MQSSTVSHPATDPCIPGETWTAGRRLKWFLIAALVCPLFGPSFLQHLQPPRNQILDFYQEWASARNVVNGLPAYAPPETTVEKYLGMNRAAGGPWILHVNVHPPTSILLALPLQGMTYWNAFLVWNVVSLALLGMSLWLIVRTLGIEFSVWSLLPLVSVLLLCDPLWQQVIQGQLNLVLLLLIVGVWAADRAERPAFSGGLAGLALAIKLFPGFLFLYFLCQRKWRALFAGAVSLAGVTALTISVAGLNAYDTYFTEILPAAGKWKAAWNNASLAGFWHKLFAPGATNGTLRPLVENPVFAAGATLVSWGVVVSFLVPTAFRARTPVQRDLAFGATVVGMLLVSPVTWEHYFLMLILPLAVVWMHLPQSRFQHALLATVVVAFCLPVILLGNLLIPGGFFEGRATPLHVLTVLSFQCYALVLLYGLIVVVFRTGEHTVSTSQ